MAAAAPRASRREGPFRYDCFGIGVSVPVPVPTLPSTDRDPDFSVDFGAVPASGRIIWSSGENGERFVAREAQEGLVLEWLEARYRVSRDAAVVDGVSRQRALEELFGPAWTVALAFRGVETLHGSAVATPWGSVAVLGAAGMGKSTLTWRLSRAGFPLISDDLLAIPEGSITPLVGPAQIRLRPDLVEREAVEAELDDYGKYPVVAERASEVPPLALMLCLSDEARYPRAAVGAEAVALLRRNLFSPVLSAEGQALRRFALVADLAARVRIMEAPPRRLRVSDIVRLLEAL